MTHNTQPNALDNVEPVTLGQPRDAQARHDRGGAAAKRGSGHKDLEGVHPDEEHTPGHDGQGDTESHEQPRTTHPRG